MAAEAESATTIVRDALHLVISFLSLGETASASATCRHWHAAATSEPLKKTSCRVDLQDVIALLPSLATSHLRRHCTALSGGLDAKEWAQLLLLQELPRLASLQLRLTLDHAPPTDLPLPTTLTSIRLELLLVGCDVNTMMRSLVHARRLRTVELDFLSWSIMEGAASLDLTPLRELPELAHLTLNLTPRRITYFYVLRSRSALRSLVFNSGAWSFEFLQRVCAEGHSLQNLEVLDMRASVLDLHVIKLLSALPALTALHPKGHTVAAHTAVLAHLQLLPRLQHLDVALQEGEFEMERDAPSLLSHVSLRDLALRNLRISRSTLTALLSSLPNLEELALCGVTMKSLSPLASLVQLHTLYVDATSDECESHVCRYPCSEAHGCLLRDDLDQQVSFLERLPALTSLTLHQLGRTRMIASVLNQLCVPSVRMPRLVQFECSKGKVDEETTMLQDEQGPIEVIQATATTVARDAFYLVLSFLTLKETARADRTCHDWRAACISAPPKKNCRLVLKDLSLLPKVAGSHLRRHFTAVGHTSGDPDWCLNVGTAWSDLGIICSSLPRLEWMQVIVPENNFPADFRLPITLRHIRLWFPSEAFHLANAVVKSLVMAPRLSFVALEFLGLRRTIVDLRPLRSLPELAHLTLPSLARMDDGPNPTHENIDVLRSLSGLRSLTVGRGWWAFVSLSKLCAEGHQLSQLEMLDMSSSTFGIWALELLSSLPALTAIHDERSIVRTFESAVLSQLHRLPRLQSLGLHFVLNELGDHLGDEFDTDGVPLLESHPSLRSLKLFNLSATQSSMTDLLASMPNLRVLTLDSVALESFAAFNSLVHLETLSVDVTSRDCDSHNASETCSVDDGCDVRHDLDDQITVLARLPRLTSLMIERLGRTSIDPSIVAQLRVPSARLPGLTTFECRTPRPSTRDHRRDG